MPKPILCLDFDGVIHSYTSGWEGPDVISDPPVPGAMEFIVYASQKFTIAVFSSRSGQPGGIQAMKDYIQVCIGTDVDIPAHTGQKAFEEIQWPTTKPAAFLTIDDRAITFNGVWPSLESLFDFRVWYKKKDPVE